ncbi:hypothetical protein P7M41_26690, partial [Vibrio parahaemolyticus]|nr:hypothetical protein [Vibrio parahaemolyticus]
AHKFCTWVNGNNYPYQQAMVVCICNEIQETGRPTGRMQDASLPVSTLATQTNAARMKHIYMAAVNYNTKHHETFLLKNSMAKTK